MLRQYALSCAMEGERGIRFQVESTTWHLLPGDINVNVVGQSIFVCSLYSNSFQRFTIISNPFCLLGIYGTLKRVRCILNGTCVQVLPLGHKSSVCPPSSCIKRGGKRLASTKGSNDKHDMYLLLTSVPSHCRQQLADYDRPG